MSIVDWSVQIATVSQKKRTTKEFVLSVFPSFCSHIRNSLKKGQYRPDKVHFWDESRYIWSVKSHFSFNTSTLGVTEMSLCNKDQMPVSSSETCPDLEILFFFNFGKQLSFSPNYNFGPFLIKHLRWYYYPEATKSILFPLLSIC